MATKKLYSNASSTYYYLLESTFTEDSTSTANNTSTLTVTANISNHNIRFSDTKNSTLKIYWYDNNLNANGTLVASLNVKSIYPSSASTVMTKTATGTVTVTHKDDGTLSGYAKAVWTKASGASSYCPNSGDVSTDTTALTNIPRYASITSFSVSKRDETSVLYNYATDVACDLIEYSKNNGSSWSTLPSNKIVTGLTANTAYNFKLRVRRTDSQLKTTSGTVAQTTYAYPYLTSTPNFVIGNALTVSFYNPLNRTVTLQITANGVTDTSSYASTGTSYTGYNAFNNQQFLYSSLGTSGKTATYSMTLTCLQQTSTKTGTYSIDETACKPVINANSSTVRDVNTNITTLTLDASKIVKDFSTARLHVVANKISNVYDTTATISYYKYVGDGSTWTSGDKDILNATTASYQVQIVNSRGIASDIVTLSATLHPYFNPTIANFKVVRPTQVGNEMKLSANGALFHQYFDSGNQNYNGVTIKWYVRTSTEDAWTLGGNITNDTSMSYTSTSWNFAQKLISNPLDTTNHVWDYMTQYYFKIEVIDRLQTVNSTTYVSIGQAYYEWWRENDINRFKVNGKAIVTRDLDVNNDLTTLGTATFDKGVRGKHLDGGSGSSGYYYAFYLEEIGTYANQYISFDVFQRARTGTVEIMLNNVNSTTIGVTAVNKTGNINVYYKIEDNKFKFYVQKSSDWDFVEISNLQIGKYSRERVRLTWVNQTVSSLPTSYVTVENDTLKFGKSAITVTLSTQTTLTVTSAYNYVKIPLDVATTSKDNKGCFTLSSNAVTINRTGWYAISGTALVRSSNTSQTAILFISTTQGSAGETYVPISRQGAFTSITLPPFVRKLYAGNTVSFQLSGSTTGDIVVAGSNRFTYMTIQEV